MKKNKVVLGLILIVIASQWGFDWPTPKSAEKKAQTAPAKAGQEIPFPQMMGVLSQNMVAWSSLPVENKKKAVEAVIAMYRNRENSAILKPADFYVGQIDESLKANPAFQGTTIMSIVKIMAVMEYDFYNGQNKDALAKEVLGEKMAQSLRARH